MPRNRMVTVRLTEDSYLMMQEIAADEGEHLAVIVRRAIRQFLVREAQAGGESQEVVKALTEGTLVV